MIELSVIIVNYNARHFLQLCLDALQEALDGIAAETIIIDNQSTDDSYHYISRHYPWVHFVKNTCNEGFGKANNRGIKRAKGKYILILNPDTIVQKASIVDSLNTLKKNKHIGAVGLRMLDGSGRFLPESKRGLPQPRVAFYKAFGLARLFPQSRRYARYYLGHLSAEKDHDIEILAGAYMMIPKDILNACHGFDEDFFMYGEDIDLSYRISLMGYTNRYLAQHPIIHFKGESAGRDAVWAQHFYQAMQLFSEKHFSHRSPFYNRIINTGIALRKALSKPSKRSAPTADLSQLNLVVITNEQPPADGDFFSRFKSVSIKTTPELPEVEADALLFMPDVERALLIHTMALRQDKMQYFFVSSDKDIVLSSPRSTSQGEIWKL